MFKFFNYFRLFIIPFLSIISCQAGEITMMLTSLKIGEEQYTKNTNSNVFTGINSAIQYEIIPDYSQINFNLNGFSGDLPLTFSCEGQEPGTFAAKPVEGYQKQEFEDLPTYLRSQLLSDYSNSLNRDVPLVGTIPFEWKIDHEQLGEVIVGLNYHFKVTFGDPKVENNLKKNFSIVYLQYGDLVHKPFFLEILRLPHHKLSKESLPSVYYDVHGYWRKEKEITWGLGEEDTKWLETNNLATLSSYQGEDTKKSTPRPWKILKGFEDRLKGKRFIIENCHLKPSPYVYIDELNKSFLTIIEEVDLKECISNKIYTLELIKKTDYSLFHSDKPKGKFEFNSRSFYKCVNQKKNKLSLIQQWEEFNADNPHTTSFTSGFGEGAFSVLDLTKCAWNEKDIAFWSNIISTPYWNSKCHHNNAFNQMNAALSTTSLGGSVYPDFPTCDCVKGEGRGHLNPDTLPYFMIKYSIGTYLEEQKKNISKILMWLAEPFLDKGTLVLQGDELYVDLKTPIKYVGHRRVIENLVSQRNIQSIYVDNLQSNDYNKICEISSSGKFPEHMKARSYWGELIYSCMPHEAAIAGLTHCLEKIVIINNFKEDWEVYPTGKLWDLMSQCANLKEIHIGYVSIGSPASGSKPNGYLEIEHERWANIAYKLRGVKYLDVQGARANLSSEKGMIHNERMANRISSILENNADSLLTLDVRRSECLDVYFNRFNKAVQNLTNLKRIDIRDNVLSNNQTVYFSETLSKLSKLREVRIDMPYSVLPILSSIGYCAANGRKEALLFPLLPLFEPIALMMGLETDQYVDTIKNLTKIPCLNVLEVQLHGFRRNEDWARKTIEDLRQEANKSPIQQIILS